MIIYCFHDNILKGSNHSFFYYCLLGQIIFNLMTLTLVPLVMSVTSL